MQISRESYCNNKAHVVSIDDINIYYSYATIIGVTSATFKGRLENFWRPTTGRHFNQLCINTLPIVTADEITAFLNSVKVIRNT
jgi:20S proteasome alpha/beta subunit